MTVVCHLSSAHTGLDVRIFHKECVSLANAGYDTHLVINALAEEVDFAQSSGIQIHRLPSPSNRTQRILKQAWRCYQIGRKVDADVYHFHDPELIPYGVLLRLTGKKVIYDVHEDLPRDVLSKDWIPSVFRRFVSLVASAIEHFVGRHFFTIVAATPFIANRFKVAGCSTAVDVNNFPVDIDFPRIKWSDKSEQVCYVGNITRARGVVEMVSAMGFATSGARLALYGSFREQSLVAEIRESSGWRKVNEHGFVGRPEIRKALKESKAGLVTLHPLVNFIDAVPVKMFEYMSAGIPVIASDFPMWKKIINDADCGVCVNPQDPKQIADAIDFLIENPDTAEKMGENGRKAVALLYNWHQEEKKLLALYADAATQ